MKRKYHFSIISLIIGLRLCRAPSTKCNYDGDDQFHIPSVCEGMVKNKPSRMNK